MATFKYILDVLVSITIILGVPSGLYQYFRSTRSERVDREYKTYNALDEKYIEFQRLCLQYPYLDIFEIPDRNPVVLDEQQKKQQLIAFALLFSIFERAYIMYLDQRNKVRNYQWSGWDEFIQQYCTRENFRSAWKTCGTTYDLRFEKYIKAIIHEQEQAVKLNTLLGFTSNTASDT